MLLVSKVKINVPLACSIKGVPARALVAACRAIQELPANGTLQNGGHILFFFKLDMFVRMFETKLQSAKCKG
jgi:hypothetical protein